ncbi:hypothetical protein BBK82_42185 [Lentzea guizhouensis]|uniref:Tetratricopeptide repeat protein n=1 Tax=Lentzea guizhouensis TaxID=1586287 RepID=A0A1B2HV17_9PSEU|nr:hypothetical protein [Lentzea guizhouensis]ANZ41584.1 hypothetical protein BBK82_42185 [Lentzea guizhouensis]
MTAAAHARDLDRARAADLARAGRHDDARLILEDLGRDPATLDLLARVHAQRGDLAAAEAAWRRCSPRSRTTPRWRARG